MVLSVRMGTGIRVFLVDDNDSVQCLPLTRLERLLRFDRGEGLPQHAGRRMRSAMVFLEVAGRQVLSINKVDYFLLPFDDKGRIDKKEWERAMRLGMNLLPPLFNKDNPKQVIDASHRFARRRYEHEFKWKPSWKVEDAILNAVFKSA